MEEGEKEREIRRKGERRGEEIATGNSSQLPTHVPLRPTGSPGSVV